MIPELGSPYLPSGALSPSGARTALRRGSVLESGIPKCGEEPVS
ncbi:Transcription factor 7-like 1 [Ophiophagus hannah]|uniref:Transcription factor 7-like 1 n=1 Tax=Ophiophagus hannah TaxID=8665 RepID=V8PCQ1_OPHHA|nr:Transcription factor 7-like 1 [Ophiophagus hannah]